VPLPFVTIRRMALHELASVEWWLREPHVARWFLPETGADAELEEYRQGIEDPFSATTMCMVELAGRPIGWCQWYRWEDYPAAAECIGAQPGEIGADFAIGDRGVVRRGVGTAMIAALVEVVRQHYPRAGLLITPEAENQASRRVLEKNGFVLVDVRPLPWSLTTGRWLSTGTTPDRSASRHPLPAAFGDLAPALGRKLSGRHFGVAARLSGYGPATAGAAAVERGPGEWQPAVGGSLTAASGPPHRRRSPKNRAGKQ
jgi:RimJ/RimL family protein N-acetyltransferase